MQKSSVRTAALAGAVTAIIAGALSGTPARATEGYFQHGFSAIQKA